MKAARDLRPALARPCDTCWGSHGGTAVEGSSAVFAVAVAQDGEDGQGGIGYVGAAHELQVEAGQRYVRTTRAAAGGRATRFGPATDDDHARPEGPRSVLHFWWCSRARRRRVRASATRAARRDCRSFGRCWPTGSRVRRSSPTWPLRRNGPGSRSSRTAATYSTPCAPRCSLTRPGPYRQVASEGHCSEQMRTWRQVAVRDLDEDS